MSRFLFLIYIWISLTTGWPMEALAGEKVFNTVSVKGGNYINLADFTRYYGFDQKMQRKDLDITLKSKYKTVQFKINSCECFVNDIRVWLDNSPLEYRNSILIPELDVTKTFDPMLRQWAIPQRKVKTIMIDPGHGGEDRGSPGFSKNTEEKKMTLDLAIRLEKLLQNEGFFTLMTRRKDIYVSLEDRSQLANASDADIFISLHFNAVKSKEAKGIETYCLTPAGLNSTGAIHRFGFSGFDEEPGNRFDAHNTLLAYLVQQKLIKNMAGVEDRGVKRSRFFVIKATKRPSILVEGGFLSNPTEEKQILNSAYRDQLAATIANGIIRYAELMNGFSKKK